MSVIVAGIEKPDKEFIKIAPEDCRLQAADEWCSGARRTRTFGLGAAKAAPNVRTDLLFL
jgi:hypothetical protein